MFAGTSDHPSTSVRFTEWDQGEIPFDPPSPKPTYRTSAIPSGSSTVRRGAATSIQVNVDAFGNNIPGDAANEPSIAIDPTDPNRIVIGWRQFDTIESNFRQAGWAYSEDAGATWTFPGTLEPGVFRSDPVLGVSSTGVFYYFSLTEDFTCDMFASFDGGKTWPRSVPALGGDKGWMVVDTTNGPGEGNIYTTWSGDYQNFSRSNDGGATFSVPVDVRSTWGTIAVGPDSEIYAIDTWGKVSKSSNAWNSSEQPMFKSPLDSGIGRSGGYAGPNPGGLLGQPWIAVDNSTGPTRGNIYALTTTTLQGQTTDVVFAASTDGAKTWSPAKRIDNDPDLYSNYRWFGTMSVAPNGRIDVVWNDTRGRGEDNLSELYYSFSEDAGTTWSLNIPVSPVFNSHVGWPNQAKIGDYYHMVSDNDGAHLAYAATFNGEQDVYYLWLGPKARDCNENGFPDNEDVTSGRSEDCNDDGYPDECDPDCNENGHSDQCDLLQGRIVDCNRNHVLDECETADGRSPDCNGNAKPDECEGGCNANGIPDSCDIESDTSLDCNENQVPDECEVDCNDNNIPDTCDLATGTSADCNKNEIPDECDIENAVSLDCNDNQIPDECEPDCNYNGQQDDCDINQLTSGDCDRNGIPDECDKDCNGNGLPDTCDIEASPVIDCNYNESLDECDLVRFSEVQRSNVIISFERRPQYLIAADIDGDGDADVLEGGPASIQWHENLDSRGNFKVQPNPVTATFFTLAALDVSDLDGDGDLDVLTASTSEGTAAWYENTDGLGTFGSQKIITATVNFPTGVIAFDIDGDQDSDVVASGAYFGERLVWCENLDGKGAFGPARPVSQDMTASYSVFPADFDGDGDVDLLSANEQEDVVAWYENQDGLGNFGERRVVTTAIYRPRLALAADMDGDGDEDVIAQIGDGVIAWFENTDGTGIFGEPRPIDQTGRKLSTAFSTPDIDGDGDPDVLATVFETQEIVWYENNGRGMLMPPQQIGFEPHRTLISAADLDSDEDLDVMSSLSKELTLSWVENTLTSKDCNGNNTPDECDLSSGASTDCDSNEIPDACQKDMDGDVTIDVCDDDIDGDGIPNDMDACIYTSIGHSVNAEGRSRGDVDGDCIVTLNDHFFFAFCLSISGPGAPPVLNDCSEVFDFDRDGDVDLHDAQTFMSVLGS